MSTATRRADMFTEDGQPSDDDPREHGPRLGGERATLVESLRCQRLTLEVKCAGLDAEAMARRSVEPSTMSLLGLVRHLAEMFVFMLQRTEDALEGPKAFAEKRKPEWKMRLAPSRGNAGAGACRG